MLQYVLWAKTPPSFAEMIDAIAVRLDESPGFKPENRLFELTDVMTQCSSLLTSILPKYGRREIHLAHSSVKEYLTSQDLPDLFKELLSEFHARSTIAKTSIRYLIDVANLHHDSMISSGKSRDDLSMISASDVDLQGNFLGRTLFSVLSETDSLCNLKENSGFSFVRSAGYWTEHAKVVEAIDEDIPRIVMQLYGQEYLLDGFSQPLESVPENSRYRHQSYGFSTARYRPEPLIHACYFGLEIVARRLLESDAQLITSSSLDSPLHAASFAGHHSIVKMLLGRGAAVDGCMVTSPITTKVPLIGASRNGHIEIVKTLLRHGARRDLLGWDGETALEIAVKNGHLEIVQLLVAPCDCIPFHPLFRALSRKPIDDKMVSLLCSKPVVPDSRVDSRRFTHLLNHFIRNKQRGYEKILLEKGHHVPVDLSNPYIDWPELSELSKPENVEVARILLDRGVYPRDHLAQYARPTLKRKRTETAPKNVHIDGLIIVDGRIVADMI
jgi:hypothetical protein